MAPPKKSAKELRGKLVSSNLTTDEYCILNKICKENKMSKSNVVRLCIARWISDGCPIHLV